MSDVKDILNSILTDEKLLNSRAFRDKVYSDEPIIKRASQIKTPDTPQKIKDMKAIAYTPEAYWKTSAWLFYNQGKFMEDFSDVYEYTTGFTKFYPTYRDLDNEQLRGYFSWRSYVRKGEYKAAPMPFVFIYAYELINNIGVKAPEEGLALLKELGSHYTDEALAKHLPRWIVDYCVYYELDHALISDNPDIRFDTALLKLINWEDTPDEDLFAAITALSSYPAERSRFYIQYPEEFRAAAVRVFRAVSAFFRDHRKNSLCEKYFGHITEMNCRLFEASVFYDRNTSRSTDYSLNAIHSYTCRSGIWRCRRFYGCRTRNGQLGELMKMLDYLMREKYDFRYKLRPAEVSKNIAGIVSKELDLIAQENSRREALKIEIDLSKLESIRSAADITRDKLIVEEEENVPEEYAPEPVQEDIPAAESPLTDAEILFLRALLRGGDWAAAAKNAGTMPSILADSINEKLFDFFGDTVIDMSTDVPELIEDYIDELQGFVS